MFDYLRIHPDLLPVSEEEKSLLAAACSGEFQTKSLHRVLTILEITPDGRFIRAWVDHSIYLSEEDLPEEYIVEVGMESMVLMGLKVPLSKITWVEEKHFTGEIWFYESVEQVWYEFCAHFLEGKLSYIEKISPIDEAPAREII